MCHVCQMPSNLQTQLHIILKTTMQQREQPHHSMDEETKVQRIQITCPPFNVISAGSDASRTWPASSDKPLLSGAVSHILLIQPGQQVPGLFSFIFVPVYFGVYCDGCSAELEGLHTAKHISHYPTAEHVLMLFSCPEKPFLLSPNTPISTIKAQKAIPPCYSP